MDFLRHCCVLIGGFCVFIFIAWLCSLIPDWLGWPLVVGMLFFIIAALTYDNHDCDDPEVKS